MAKGVVIVTGMPASGKTSIIGSLAKKGRFRIVTIGTLMADSAIKKGIVKDRDELRYLKTEAIDRLRHAAFIKISQIKGPVIVNTHATIEQNGRFVAGLPYSEVRRLDLKGLIYIEADPHAIIKRRAKDGSRHREVEGVREIESQRLMDLSTLAMYASGLNIPLYIIQNKEGSLKESQTRFMGALKDIYGEK